MINDIDSALRELPAQGFGFMLVVARVGTTLLLGPALGEAELPPGVRVALAVLLAVLVTPLLRDALPGLPGTAAGLVGLIGTEVVVGAWIGFLARVMAMALAIAGGWISLMVGLSSVLQIDPALGQQVPALQRMAGLAAVALLFASGLYLLPMEAILGSYEVAPPGGAFDAGGAARLVAGAVSGSFALALRLAAPFVVTAMVWHAAMGLVSRLVPGIQVHVLSAPAQIASGLLLLAAASAALFAHWSAGTLRAFSSLPGL